MSSKYQIMCSCIKCKQETTTSQLSRSHGGKCPGAKTQTRFPNNFGRTAWNKDLKGDERCSRKGINVGRTLTEQQKNHLSSIAKARGLGGYQPNAGRSKKFYVPDSFGKEVCLQSTFELKCSQLLNDLQIHWIRPTALKYDNRNYFADFYLPKYDLYLDPKNSYKAKLDTNKIEKVKEQNNVKVIVLLEHELTHEFIKSLCS
jgi:hypothetical protein